VEFVGELLDKPRTLLGLDASEQEIVSLARDDKLRDFRYIHFATHGLVDMGHPQRSALILTQLNLPDQVEAASSGEFVFDGRITAGEIASQWRLDADLVTLSACETGLGRRVVGEGYVGFTHALFTAGARSVVVSLWKVDDRATALLMQRFYENLTGRYSNTRAGMTGVAMDKVTALQEAKARLRQFGGGSAKPYAHPAYWSAFVLMGDRY
jgi:CHAT domain-containing protein